MSVALQQYARRHGCGDAPLLELRRLVQTHGPPDATRLGEWARELGLPAATIRGVLSYYDQLAEATHTTRICRGTSCMLARGGNAPIDAGPSVDAPVHEVYCLGYCDRSPVALAPGDRLVTAGPSPSPGPSHGPDHSKVASGPPDIRCVARQPVVTRRIGRGDFAPLHAATDDDAYETLRDVLNGAPADVLAAMEASGERGRGGAAFPTAFKWRRCADAPGAVKYVIANGDEGDPGSFIDRVLMEQDPHGVLEGMAICAFAIGAEHGIVFVRAEYPEACTRMQQAIEEAEAAGFLGGSIFGTSFSFTVTVVSGLGSYVCGEETALLNAIEGLRGEVRLRPPYPVEQGLYGRPTVVNNVETLANIPVIVRDGGVFYRTLGTDASSGTKAMCLNRGFQRPGIVEIEFGLSLRELIEDLGGGGRDGQAIEAVILGGPMGSVVTPGDWDVPICYDAMGKRRLELGHGGLVTLTPDTDYRRLLAHWLAFMQDESCGKCVPCREGSRQALDIAEQTATEHTGTPASRDRLERLLEIMADGSLCGFGQQTPRPIGELLEHFGDRIFEANP